MSILPSNTDPLLAHGKYSISQEESIEKNRQTSVRSLPISGRSEIIGLEETQKYQRFAGSREAVFTPKSHFLLMNAALWRLRAAFLYIEVNQGGMPFFLAEPLFLPNKAVIPPHS